MKPVDKRDPIKKAPLRVPGQSLSEHIQDIVYGDMMPWLVIGIFVAFLTAIEWFWWVIDWRPSPYWVTVLAVCYGGLAIWKIRRHLARLVPLKLDRKGEQAVGQFLQNALLRKGYWVVHDIPEDNYNIDHAIIGPGGVFAIETKTISKPRGDAKIFYDGNEVLVDGLKPDRNPVVQAEAASSRLREILLEYTGHSVAVRPVVLYPSWYVEGQPKEAKTWVLSEKRFSKFLDREPELLTADRIFVLAAGLGRYIRDREKQMGTNARTD